MINALVLDQDRLPATEHVTGIGSLGKRKDNSFVFGVKAPAASRTAVGIMDRIDRSVV
jgi:hypothetical protein